jgi:hypothetical protein
MDTFTKVCDVIITGSKKTTTNLTIDEFVEKRKAGAKKIETQSRKKGGTATLTAIHFAAKQTPYKEALKCVEKDQKKSLEEKVNDTLKQLKNWKSMSQRDFQAITGKLEALGEVYLQDEK